LIEEKKMKSTILFCLTSIASTMALATPVLFTTNVDPADPASEVNRSRVENISVYVDGSKRCYTMGGGNQGAGNCSSKPNLSAGLHEVTYVWAACNNPDSCPILGRATHFVNVPEQIGEFVVRIPTVRVRWYNLPDGTRVNINGAKVYQALATVNKLSINMLAGCYTSSYFKRTSSEQPLDGPAWPPLLPNNPDPLLQGFDRFCVGSDNTYPVPAADNGNPNDTRPPHVRISASYQPN
jgi:hypothetical protein